MAICFTDPLPRYLTPQTLLAHLTNQAIAEEDMTPSLLFFAASVALLSGVMQMDRSVAPEEMAHLQEVVGICADADLACRRLNSHLVLGINRHQVYLNPRLFLVLCEALTMPQRLLLLGLGYGMATADGHLSQRESMYLQAIAQRLQIHPQHRVILEACYTDQPVPEREALWEVAQHLDPTGFQPNEPLFRVMARALHSNLPSASSAA